MDVWFPVQMDHMEVNEAYRVWHGAPFLDDALQAPVNWQHFDGYSMGASTQTKYKPYERIPGLAVGGWFDAGDFDIQTGSHCDAVLSLVDTWEKFQPLRDETYVDYATKYVDIHRPDGKPDILAADKTRHIKHGGAGEKYWPSCKRNCCSESASVSSSWVMPLMKRIICCIIQH